MRGTAGGAIPQGARGHMGRNLGGTHPISFVVTDELVAASNARGSPLVSLEQMRANQVIALDQENKMQCTTCHDPHDDSNFGSSGIHFYRTPGMSDVCEACHKL